MNEDLVKRFLPRFIETGLNRIAKSRELLKADFPGNASQIAAELHALAGDASVIGFRDLAEAVRGLEAEILQGERSAEACDQSLSKLADDVRALTPE